MRQLLLSALMFSAALALATPAALADGMRCGTKLVSDGDSLYRVRSSCGEPNFKQHRVEQRRVSRWVSGPCAPNGTSCGQYVESTVEVQIDEWTYDFGPHEFVRTVVFEEGRLLQVLTGDYGAP